LSWADAKTCAGTLVSYLWDESGSHRISNDLSRLGGAVYTNSTTKLKSDAEIESLIRNSCHLLSSRQNLFTVLLAAQVYDGDAVFAEQRAVAVVWRDPVPDADGRHPCFVRFFKLLAE